jgi:hypothetical protein
VAREAVGGSVSGSGLRAASICGPVWYIFAIVRKRLAILGIWLIWAGMMAGQANKDSGPNPHPAKQEQPALHPANGEQGQTNAGNDKGKPDSVSHRWYASLKWPQWMQDSNWWLVIIAGLTGCVVGWQSWETRKAAKATQQSVDAITGQTELLKASVTVAEKNVDAFINKERAWVFVMGKVTDGLVVTLYAENRGQSPARVVSGFFDCETVDRSTISFKAPDYTRTSEDFLFPEEVWLLPKKKYKFGYYDAYAILDSKGQAFLDKVDDFQYWLWFYGALRYWDNISNAPRETRFCLDCHIPDHGESWMEAVGPEEYNRKT